MIELSVVIATYNRADRLSGVSRRARGSNDLRREPQDVFEVVVVVDGSSDGTLELLASYRARFPLRVVAQENAGQPAALNHGVEEARGRFCLLMDDDVSRDRSCWPSISRRSVRRRESSRPAG